MKLTPKAIEYCHDSGQYNVMKLWALKDYELIFERVSAIVRVNPYLAYICAEGCDIMNDLVPVIAEYIDSKLDKTITSKRQFSSFILVKLKMELYDEVWELMYNYGNHLVDGITVKEIVYGLMDTESDRYALVVFYACLQKCKRKLAQNFLDMMEDHDLFFIKNDNNKKFFDTSVGYTVQDCDFRSIRLYFGNKHVLKTLFEFHASYEGWAQLSYLCEEYFFELALRDKTKAELFLMAEYISEILCVPNPLVYKLIPDNSKASEEEYICVDRLYKEYMDEHGYSEPSEAVKSSRSYYVMKESGVITEAVHNKIRKENETVGTLN